MATEKQIEANRANAQKSTGPKTEEGKARSAMNGFKCDITGLSTVMTIEDQIARHKFVTEIVADLKPVGAVERHLANVIALDNWRLDRIKAVEENIFGMGLVLPERVFTHERVEAENCLGHAHTWLTHSDKINRISLYEARLNKIIRGNMDLLNQRQAARKVDEHKPETKPEKIQHFTASNGFAPANSETAPEPAAAATPPETKAA